MYLPNIQDMLWFLPDTLEPQPLQMVLGQLASVWVAFKLLAWFAGYAYSILSSLTDLIRATLRRLVGRNLVVQQVVDVDIPSIHFRYLSDPSGTILGYAFVQGSDKPVGRFVARDIVYDYQKIEDVQKEMAMAGAPPPRPVARQHLPRVIHVLNKAGLIIGLASVMRIDGNYFVVTAKHVAESADALLGGNSHLSIDFPRKGFSLFDVSFHPIEADVMSRLGVRSSGTPRAARRKKTEMVVYRSGNLRTTDVVPLEACPPSASREWNLAFYHKSNTQKGDSGALLFQGGAPVAIHVGADLRTKQNVAINLGPLLEALFPSTCGSQPRVESVEEDSLIHQRVEEQLLNDSDVVHVRNVRIKRKHYAIDLDFFDDVKGRWGDDAVRDDRSDAGDSRISDRDFPESDFRAGAQSGKTVKKPPLAPQSPGPKKARRRKKTQKEEAPNRFQELASLLQSLPQSQRESIARCLVPSQKE